jgi:uncharacterized protein YjbJ (UPF0337 family)
MPYGLCLAAQEKTFRRNRRGHLKWEVNYLEGVTMSMRDKARNKAEELKGTVKERIGDASDNESMQAEGARERAAAKAKQAGENVKDAGRDARDAFRG